MTRFEYVLCRLAHGEALTVALREEGLPLETFIRALKLDTNKRSFAMCVAQGREVVAMRAKKV